MGEYTKIEELGAMIVDGKTAQEIVTAVNCHDELVEAIQLIVDSNDHLTVDGVRREYQHNMMRGILKARAALAKANQSNNGE